MTDTDLSPRASCRLVQVAGFCFCRCGWSDHPLLEQPCGDAQDDAVDISARAAVEGGTDWRARDRFLSGRSGPVAGDTGGAA